MKKVFNSEREEQWDDYSREDSIFPVSKIWVPLPNDLVKLNDERVDSEGNRMEFTLCEHPDGEKYVFTDCLYSYIEEPTEVIERYFFKESVKIKKRSQV